MAYRFTAAAVRDLFVAIPGSEVVVAVPIAVPVAVEGVVPVVLVAPVPGITVPRVVPVTRVTRSTTEAPTRLVTLPVIKVEVTPVVFTARPQVVIVIVKGTEGARG